MRCTKAIVTLAIGTEYVRAWEKCCKTHWQQYANRHAYDLVCIDRPLDTTARAQQRSPAWQKCLVLSQVFSHQYERIVWIDSDVLINAQSAPDISAGVPADKVGAVSMYEQPTPALYMQVLSRMYEYWGRAAMRNYTADEYHTLWGLPSGYNQVVQSGVLVLSPKHHRECLEKVYYGYEEKGGREWHMEMRPLSYELQHAGVIHWLDGRFNTMWPEILFLHYPFLLSQKSKRSRGGRALRELCSRLGGLSDVDLKRAAMTNAFLNSYFFHLGGGELADMQLVNQGCTSFLECSL